MTVRSVSASQPCARTLASLDDAITVARTGATTVLYNLPRSLEELDRNVPPARGRSVLRRLFGR